MWNEEDLPRTDTPKPRNLDKMSIAELQLYIVELQAEIKRAEGEIVKKDASRAAAEAFFK